MNRLKTATRIAAIITLMTGVGTFAQDRASEQGVFRKILRVDNSHLIVPVANYPRGSKGNSLRLGIYDGDKLIQNLNVSLPRNDDAYWLASYPLDHFKLRGKEISIQSQDPAELGNEVAAALK